MRLCPLARLHATDVSAGCYEVSRVERDASSIIMLALATPSYNCCSSARPYALHPSNQSGSTPSMTSLHRCCRQCRIRQVSHNIPSLSTLACRPAQGTMFHTDEPLTTFWSTSVEAVGLTGSSDRSFPTAG